MYILLPCDDLFHRKHVVTRLFGYNKYLFVIKVLYSVTLDGHNEMNEVKRISVPHILHKSSGADSALYVTEITFVRINIRTNIDGNYNNFHRLTFLLTELHCSLWSMNWSFVCKMHSRIIIALTELKISHICHVLYPVCYQRNA